VFVGFTGCCDYFVAGAKGEEGEAETEAEEQPVMNYW